MLGNPSGEEIVPNIQIIESSSLTMRYQNTLPSFTYLVKSLLLPKRQHTQSLKTTVSTLQQIKESRTPEVLRLL